MIFDEEKLFIKIGDVDSTLVRHALLLHALLPY